MLSIRSFGQIFVNVAGPKHNDTTASSLVNSALKYGHIGEMLSVKKNQIDKKMLLTVSYFRFICVDNGPDRCVFEGIVIGSVEYNRACLLIAWCASYIMCLHSLVCDVLF